MAPLALVTTRKLHLNWLQIWSPDGNTCIGSKFDHQMAPIALVANFTTRQCHLHQLQIWSPVGTTYIGYKFCHQMALLGSKFHHQVDIVGKKRDHGILDPMIFSGKIRKNRKSQEKYFIGKVFRKLRKNTKKIVSKKI